MVFNLCPIRGINASQSHLVVDVEPLFALPVVQGVAYSRVREVMVVTAPVLGGAHAYVAAHRLSLVVQLIDNILAGIWQEQHVEEAAERDWSREYGYVGYTMLVYARRVPYDEVLRIRPVKRIYIRDIPSYFQNATNFSHCALQKQYSIIISRSIIIIVLIVLMYYY